MQLLEAWYEAVIVFIGKENPDVLAGWHEFENDLF